MKVEIQDDGTRTLKCHQDEDKCAVCGNKDGLFYCEMNNKLYCYQCIIDGDACRPHEEHEDIKINQVVYE